MKRSTPFPTISSDGGKFRNTWVKPCSVIWRADPMLTTNGTFDASAAWAAEIVAPESQAPTSTVHPSRISFSAATRPFSGFDSVSANATSSREPCSTIIFVASSVPFRVATPGKESTPVSGRITPTFRLEACAFSTAGKPSSDRAPEAEPAASRRRRITFLW